MYEVLKEISEIYVDDDGDIVIGADENGYNPLLQKIFKVLGLPPLGQIEVYPMDIEGDHWVVLVRLDGADPIMEFEGLTRAGAEAKVDELVQTLPRHGCQLGPGGSSAVTFTSALCARSRRKTPTTTCYCTEVCVTTWRSYVFTPTPNLHKETQ